MPSPPRRLIGVSTKMYFTFHQTKTYTTTLLTLLTSLPPEKITLLQSTTDIFLLPDHLTLSTTITQLQTHPCPIQILPGAQDASEFDTGAHTGSVSPRVLSEIGCKILELGHVERRETSARTARKAAAAARNGLIPLLCIGETNKPSTPHTAALSEVRDQVETVLAAVPDSADVILAYEPVWAIGAAAPAEAAHVLGVVRGVRELECVRRRREGSVRIVYGGSAGPGLFEMIKDGVDGLFMGRFAHDPEVFVRTVLEVAEA